MIAGYNFMMCLLEKKQQRACKPMIAGFRFNVEFLFDGELAKTTDSRFEARAREVRASLRRAPGGGRPRPRPPPAAPGRAAPHPGSRVGSRTEDPDFDSFPDGAGTTGIITEVR